jgi:spore coat polysaccharide biosynthesis predicted glycosyltransferase SpsG
MNASTHVRTVMVRCDASPEMGLGHLVRALSVAEAARSAGWSATIAGDISSGAGRALVDDAGFEVTDSSIRPGFDVVHADGYLLPGDLRSQVNSSGALLSNIEDGRFGRRPADLVFDTFIGSERTQRPGDTSGAVFRGVTYAPMRRQVLQARASRAARPTRSRQSREAISILVAMGGTAAMNATATVAGLVAEAAGRASITAVAPRERWQAIAEASPDARTLEPGPDFLSWVADADLVICTASTMLLEVACIGTPAVVLAVADNQEQTYADVVGQEFVRGLGTLEHVRDEPAGAARIIEAAVADLSAGRDWSEHGLAAVDGLGAGRIVDEWERALA